ncbi:hypothetical protein HDU96_009607 [Phlyctochytrium bullatum]|nr:hypothetical protein HDU96_009607 [Phlyctochytrium bullatum]
MRRAVQEEVAEAVEVGEAIELAQMLCGPVHGGASLARRGEDAGVKVGDELAKVESEGVEVEK